MPDLVSRVADVFLATSDIDYYIGLRAVCRGWRAATADPRGPDEDDDPRFRPHRWVMLDKLAGDDPCIVNDTNYSRRLTPDHPLAGNATAGSSSCTSTRAGSSGCTCPCSTADGLLLLEAKGRLRIFLLNPFTGRRAKPTLESLSLAGTVAFPVAFQGRAYAADMKGTVAAVDVCSSGNMLQTKLTTVVVAGTSDQKDQLPTFLVDNAPSLSDHQLGAVQVFRVGPDRKTYLDQPVKRIGNRAIFLGKHRSLSVDADNLPAIEGNCLYYVGGGSKKRGIRIHHLEDGRVEIATTDFSDNVEKRRLGPLSLAEYMMKKSYSSLRVNFTKPHFLRLGFQRTTVMTNSLTKPHFFGQIFSQNPNHVIKSV